MLRRIMQEKLEETNLEIYAYCIMPTHVHLLIRGEMKEISRFLSRVQITFAMRYNLGKQRNGHLFQNRFFSQGIENEVYFWNCMKYIHDNPVKAGLVKKPELYAFSSFREYVNDDLWLVSRKGFLMLKHEFGDVDAFLRYEEKYMPRMWFGGDEAEIYWQKRSIVERELLDEEEFPACVNCKGKFQRTAKTKQFAEKCGMSQVEVFAILRDIQGGEGGNIQKDTSPRAKDTSPE